VGNLVLFIFVSTQAINPMLNISCNRAGTSHQQQQQQLLLLHWQLLGLQLL
jgi:hypothetical protein